MTNSLFNKASRRALLQGIPAALLGFVTATASGPRVAEAKAKAGAGSAPYDPLKQVWRCTFNECDPYYYHPEKGDPDNIVGGDPIPPGTPFEDLPADWRCPICGAGKDWFVKET